MLVDILIRSLTNISTFSKVVFTSFFSLVIGIYGVNSAFAETTWNLKVVGNLDARTAITSPPVVPSSFEEIAANAFYSFSIPGNVSDPETGEGRIFFYFWRTSQNTVSSRMYVPGEFVGSQTSMPVIVGRGSIEFNEDGTFYQVRRDPSTIETSGYLLDQNPVIRSQDVLVSPTWADKPTERIIVKFDEVVLSNSPSSVTHTEDERDRSNN